MERCLYCYQPVEQGQADFHPQCSKKMFGTAVPPVLPYTKADIESASAGIQAKLSVDLGKKKGGKYILKPQTELYPSLPENEDLTMHLATLARIKTIPHSLIRLQDGSLAYITKRIDRDKKGDKIPMEDMCQLTKTPAEHTYTGSHEQIAKKIVELSAYPVLDLINYFEILLFCYLTGNADMHLQHFSLYKKEGEWALAPAYNLLSTKLARPQENEELALTLNDKTSKLQKADFDSLLQKRRIDPKVIENVYEKFRASIPEWLACIDSSFLPEEMRGKYKLLLQENATNIGLISKMQLLTYKLLNPKNNPILPFLHKKGKIDS